MLRGWIVHLSLAPVVFLSNNNCWFPLIYVTTTCSERLCPCWKKVLDSELLPIQRVSYVAFGRCTPQQSVANVYSWLDTIIQQHVPRTTVFVYREPSHTRKKITTQPKLATSRHNTDIHPTPKANVPTSLVHKLLSPPQHPAAREKGMKRELYNYRQTFWGLRRKLKYCQLSVSS